MKILLRDDVDNVGRRGDICDVADGFARNFLIPRGKAVRASQGTVAQAASMVRSRNARDAKDREAAQEVAGKFEGVVVRVPARAGEEGKLFGSVTASDIADAVTAQTGVDIDKRVLHLPEPLKSLGSHSVRAHLHRDVDVDLNVEVVAEA